MTEKVTRAEIAKLWSEQSPSQFPKIPKPFVDWRKWKPLLGTIPDGELARKIGCSRSNIIFARKRFQIDAAPSKTIHRKWTASDDAILGTVSDIAVARRRRKLGIPPCFAGTDNRADRKFSLVGLSHEIVAAVRRTEIIGLTDGQVQYIFGPLKRKTR